MAGSDLVVLKQLKSFRGWSVRQNYVHAIELVARPSRRWGLTNQTPVRCRVRFGAGRVLYLS